MLITLWRKAGRISRRLWVRVVLISVLSLVAIGLAKLFGGLIPEGLAELAGAEALDRLLEIISGSMFAATTFSVTVMVTVHQSASSQWTPRAHRSLLQDTTTQTVLATFVGAYIYAVTAIILMSTPLFGEREVFALYLMTIAVIGLVVVMLLRWILHLQTWGSLMDTAARLEAEARAEMEAAIGAPCLGANPWTGADLPPGAVPVHAKTTAYVQEIYQESLQEAAAECDARVWLDAPVGRFIHAGEVIAWIVPDRPGLAEEVQDAVRTGALRTIAQDPRFGLIQLAEIGSKALSPGINDTGTAIDIVGRLTRLLLTPGAVPGQVCHDRLWVRPLSPDDMLEDAFATIGRDAGAAVEVHMALIRNLAALTRLAEPGIANAARRHGPVAYARAAGLIGFAPDLARLRDLTPAGFLPD
jgi:uncharacterized membrane protein